MFPRIISVLILVTAACGGIPDETPGATALTVAADGSSINTPPDGFEAKVVRVVDGDTIVVDIGGAPETARLIGVDTPETVKPDTPVECFGPQASVALKELLPKGTPVILTRDEELRDVYGRLLVYVFRASDGLFVNLALVERGYGDVLVIAPNDEFASTFRAAAAAASEAERGLWLECPLSNSAPTSNSARSLGSVASR